MLLKYFNSKREILYRDISHVGRFIEIASNNIHNLLRRIF